MSAEAMLDGISIFRPLTPAAREATLARCRRHRFGRGEQIVGRHDETRDVFFVVEGKVRAVSYSLAGKEVAYRNIEAGDMFGEFSAIDGEPRSADVVALTDCLVLTMNDAVFWDILGQHPEVAAATLKRLTAQVRALTERVFEFSALAVRNRIHAELLRMARHGTVNENTATIDPAPTHAELASHISTHREAVTRELNAMARGGLVERRGEALYITDIDRLARLVESVLGDTL